MAVNKVLYNIDQRSDTTDAEKATARANIGAIGSSDVPEIARVDTSGNEYDVDTLKFHAQSTGTAIVKCNNTELGSTVPVAVLESDEGKVPVAYYRDGRKYFLLEQYKDPRIPDSASADYHKVLTVDSHGNAVWQLPAAGSSDVGVYEFTVTKVLNGTGTDLWNGSGLTDAEISESFTNCTTLTCPIHVILDDYGRLRVSLANGYGSITCESHTYVSDNANFATELGMWGFDNLCQVVAGMNRTWYVTHGDLLDQNGIRSNTNTLKSGTLTIKFDFVFNV